MICENCNGSGESRNPGQACFDCNGTGEMCDVCGEAINVCLCDDDEESDDDDESNADAGELDLED